jgi:glycosyltransferase involved in cell wall biosynthesis
MYKISVIIPTFNSEKFLDKTIESVIKQTIGFENIELILIDDFSTDQTPIIIKDFVKKYDNIISYKLKEKAGAPGNARNIGIEKAKSKYLMFMDHDDLYPEKALEILYNKINGEEDSIVIGRYKTFGEANWVSDEWVKNEIIINSLDENTNFITINNIWRMIFPKKLLQENNINFPEKMFAEDLAFMIETYLNANKIIFLPDYVYCFRIQSNENSSTSYSKSLHYIGKLTDGYFYTRNILKTKNACKYYDLLFSMHLGSWIDNIIHSSLSNEEKYQLLKNSQPLFFDLNIIDLNINPNFETYRPIMEKLRDNKLDEAFNELKDLNNNSGELCKSEISLKIKLKNKIKNILKKV